MTVADGSLEYIFIVFQRKYDLIFHMNPLLGRGITRNIKPYFLRKVKVKVHFCLAHKGLILEID